MTDRAAEAKPCGSVRMDETTNIPIVVVGPAPVIDVTGAVSHLITSCYQAIDRVTKVSPSGI